jgi:hypothetical protein
MSRVYGKWNPPHVLFKDTAAYVTFCFVLVLLHAENYLLNFGLISLWWGDSSDSMTNICASESIGFTGDMDSVGVAISSWTAYQKNKISSILCQSSLILLLYSGTLANYMNLPEVDSIYLPIPVNFIFMGFDGKGGHGNYLCAIILLSLSVCSNKN